MTTSGGAPDAFRVDLTIGARLLSRLGLELAIEARRRPRPARPDRPLRRPGPLHAEKRDALLSWPGSTREELPGRASPVRLSRWIDMRIMGNKNQLFRVAPLSLVLGIIVSCRSEPPPTPVPTREIPPWCGSERPPTPVPASEVPPWCGPGSPANPVPESKAHLYCPGYDSPSAFVDALMAGAVLPANLSPCLPLDVNKDLPEALDRGRLDQAIRQLDTFGWQMFIALSWPVERRGHQALFAPSLDGQGEPRWYGWNTTACDDMLDTSLRLSNHLDQHLWDQRGKPVGFEVAMNQPAYNNVIKHQLHTRDGQIKNPDTEFGWGEVGNQCFSSVLIKLAWKELDQHDQADRFFRRMARTPSNPTPHEVGLVGMHIAYKLSFLMPRWMWMTFEHIDNVEEKDEPACAAPAPPPRAEPLFYDKQCEPEVCPANDPTSKNPRLGPERRATQVVREVTIRPETADFNCKMRALLHDRAPGSPAQYYKLVAAQAAYKDSSGNEHPVPPSALNTVLETYQQSARVGCAECHRDAPLDSVWMLTSRFGTIR
ncbi:hypothetical protein WME88_01175 [Sorangium sp. So ce216]